MVVSICMSLGLALGVAFGLLLGLMRGTDKERARCVGVVSGRLCAGHSPKREFRQRLNDPCDWCDRVAECIDYIEVGLPSKPKG